MNTGRLTHTPARIVRKLIQDLGVGTDPALKLAWPVYRSDEPSTPDDVLTVYNTTPQNNGRSAVNGRLYRHHGIMVRVRGVNEEVCHDKANELMTAMTEGAFNALVMIDTTPYTIQSFSNVMVGYSGKELPTSRRNLVTINALVTIRQLA